jgi:hypothetical protein
MKTNYELAFKKLTRLNSLLLAERDQLQRRHSNLKTIISQNRNTSQTSQANKTTKVQMEETKDASAGKFKCKACQLGFFSKKALEKHRKT